MKRAYLIHPGEILAQELEERWRSQKYFAELIWKTPQEVSHIITWKRNINADWAIRIWLALWTSSEMWMNMQTSYDIQLYEEKKDCMMAYSLIKSKLKKIA